MEKDGQAAADVRCPTTLPCKPVHPQALALSHHRAFALFALPELHSPWLSQRSALRHLL